MPRMADFARILVAVDKVLKTDGMTTYLGLRRELAEDVASSDPVLLALTECVRGEFTGTSGQLLHLIQPVDDAGQPVDPRRLPKGWPAGARDLTTALNRHAPVLRQLGWTVSKSGRQVQWTLNPPPDEPREGGNPAPDARMRKEDESSQVNDGADDRASGRASGAHHDDDAHDAHHDQECADDAHANAHTPTPVLTSANIDHRASSASRAPNAPSLGSACAECGRTTATSFPDGLHCRTCYVDKAAS
jgi:hypothetical protein